MKTVKPLTSFSTFIIRTSIWTSTIVVLLLCLLFARLFFAPINLDFAREDILGRAAKVLPGWSISYGSADIGWDWASVRPWLAITDVKLVDRRQRLTADIPQIRVSTAFNQLLSGVGVSTLAIDDANIKLLDIGGFSDATDESLFADLFVDGKIPRPEVLQPVTEAFNRFGTRLINQAPNLNSIDLNNATVIVFQGTEYDALPVTVKTLSLNKSDRKLMVSAQVDIILANTPTRIRLAGEAEPNIGELAVNVSFSDLTPADLLNFQGVPDFLSYMEAPFGLDLSLAMASDVGLRNAGFEMVIGEGVLTNAVSYPDSAPIQYGVISGNYDVAEDRFALEQIEIGLEGASLSGDGILFWEEGEDQPGVRLNLSVGETSVSDVLRYWPIQTFPDGRHRGARAWVSQHMLKGALKNTNFQWIIEPDGTSPFENNSPLFLSFEYEDLDTHFLKTMKPMQGLKGRAILSLSTMEIFVNEGHVEGLKIDGSRGVLSKLNVKGASVGDFYINVEGDVQNVMNVLDDHPVNISQKLNIDLARLSGNAKAKAEIKTPLYKQAAKSGFSYDVEADLQNVGVSDLLKGEGLTEANLTLKLNQDELSAIGQGKLNGVQLDMRWQENFAAGRIDPVADTTYLVLSGITDEKGLQNLGVDVSEYLEGDTLAEATFVGRNLDFRMGFFSADATAAKLKLDVLGYEKKPDYAANINGSIFLNGPNVKLSPISVNGEDITVTANISIEGEKDTFLIEANASQLGENRNLKAIIKKETDSPVFATINADLFDAKALLVKDETEVIQQQNAGVNKTKPSNAADFNLLLDADEVLLYNGTIYKGFTAEIKFENAEPSFLLMKADELNLELGSNAEQEGQLTITSNNGGKLLRGLGAFAHLEGGQLSLVSRSKHWGADLSLQDAHLEIKDTKLVGQQSLGEAVDTGVVSGLDEYLEDGSIGLDEVIVPFNFEKGIIDISNMKANGPTLGMTLEGQIETIGNKINVNGVIVPAYGINSLLGKIPLLGGIFSGGDGKGLFGVTYRVKGLSSDPEVSVSRLSGIAPGFLRLLFEGKKGKVADVKVPEETETNAVEPKTEDTGIEKKPDPS